MDSQQLLGPREPRRFFVLGSKYSGKDDIFPQMQELNVVCTGFEPDRSLESIYRAPADIIRKTLKQLHAKPHARRTLQLFLQLKPGDVIAIKSTGRPRGKKPFLEIIAYALVVEREGCTYTYDVTLGHCLAVEFLETDLKRQFAVGGYSRTIDEITGPQRIHRIFGNCSEPNSEAVREIIRSVRRKRKASTSKNTGAVTRRGHDACVVDQRHNQLQEEFRKHLIAKHGEANVKLEEDFVDIKLIEPGCLTFYEIKPYDTAGACVAAGLGQVLQYVSRACPSDPIKVRIVGPFPANDDDKPFIDFVKRQLNVDFEYEAFQLED